MPTPKLVSAAWRKSSRSGAQNACVEVAALRGAIAVRDSKDPSGPALRFAQRDWTSFVACVKRGDFDQS